MSYLTMRSRRSEKPEMLLFDTSAAIEWLKGNEKLKDIETSFAVSVVTVYEMMWAAERRSQATANKTRKFLDNLLMIDMSQEIAYEAAHGKAELMNLGLEKHIEDLVIAATAKQHNLDLITFDTDFKDIARVIPMNYECYEF